MSYRFLSCRRGGALRNGLPLAAALALSAPGAVRAQAPAPPPAAPTTPLPVRDVTLFSSGVSYTEREGEVTGDATVDLSFRTTQINDILKSLVLLDEKGTVQPAVYAAKDPIGRTLESFAVDVSQPTDRADLLNRLKGAHIVAEGGGTPVYNNPALTPKFTIQGQLVGVDRETSANSGNQSLLLSVLGDDGLQTVSLDEVRSIKFLDSRIEREFRDALTLQATGSDDKRRQVTLRFDGSGSRKVHVGYVSEAPLWKISYRLLIGGAAGQSENKPYLQGWAMVENTTDDDWNGIRLSLVSGRPISFIQDLYQPLYLPRPVVPPDVVASPFPQLAEATVEDKKDASAGNASYYARGGGGGGGMGGFAGGGRALAAAPAPEAVASVQAFASEGNVISADALNANFAKSVQAEASGEKRGELFAYNVNTPVTLPRQQAAMIPVLAQGIGGEKVSLYNADTGARFPLNGFRIRNTTGLHLKGGPITVFDQGVYAGDARMEDVPPGDSRIVTYAVDMAVEGQRDAGPNSAYTTRLSLLRGVLQIKHVQRVETIYTLRNKSDQPRLVVVEHPYDSQTHLLQPPGEPERTATLYRFDVHLDPQKTAKLTVLTEQPISESVGLLDLDVKTVISYTRNGEISAAIKTALQEVVARRAHEQDLQSQASAAEDEIKSIEGDQDRVRKNMAELDHNSALYKRYVDQLDTQETRIQALRDNTNRLHAAAGQVDRELRAYLDTLTLSE